MQKLLEILRFMLEMGKPLFDYKEIPLSRKVDPSNITLDINKDKFIFGFLCKCRKSHI